MSIGLEKFGCLIRCGWVGMGVIKVRVVIIMVIVFVISIRMEKMCF